MTVIYNMSIDRADKPWIGDRRLTEMYVGLVEARNAQRREVPPAFRFWANDGSPTGPGSAVAARKLRASNWKAQISLCRRGQ